MLKILHRMEQYRPMIKAKIKEYGVPAELIAIPIIESGYRNLPQNPQRSIGAGLWMFIKHTATAYGLRVNETVDERLDVLKETDAAMRLLKSEKIRFGKWPLSVLAYNAGDKIVTKGIFKTGSHNAWVLIEHGFQGEKDYLPRLMAAMIIMKNPDLIK
jgi:membrane-bound lytic murein transglycosylase D